MAGAFYTTILLVIVADVTVFRQPLVTAKSGTSTCTSMDDDCNNSTEGVECRVFNHIKRMPILKRIYMKINNSSHKEALEMLRNSSSAMAIIDKGCVDHEMTLLARLYLLSTIVNDLGDEEVESEISELLLSVISHVLRFIRKEIECIRRVESDAPPLVIAGSTLLWIVDMFALDNYNLSRPMTNSRLSEDIDFHVGKVLVKDDESDMQEMNIEMQNISTPKFELDDAVKIHISIPNEVLRRRRGSNAERTLNRLVRMASLLFRNMSRLLPNSLDDGAQNDINEEDRVLRLASPVISASFQCDNCTTSNLSTPVEVIFTHLSYDKALLMNDENGTTTCVFWEFENDTRQGSILFTGEWSTTGCETYFNSTSTVCRCNHLTHFAILLSARPLEFPSPQVLALQITGYIGVSVSLVAMAATIFIFLFLKPLRTMRNYIHIQLCVTLGIAQIIFVAGVEPRLGEGGEVPIGCRSVAVLLHYWFLVSFMWMLMEGVVLYIALVRVFTKHKARYAAAFTIASYGLPLLYVGGLTVPLGFVRTKNYREDVDPDYGYEQACYLSHRTSFVWSLLVPVILIFLANIGFFIMAIVIMYRHQKRQNTDDKKHKVKQWIKASISLTVVMGITWIIGFLVIEIEELFALSYIFTIFVAFQGVFIFIIFVLLSKQVKENYAKWWKAKVAESDFLSKHFGSKILTSGTGVSAQNNNLPPASPVACSKTSRQSSNPGISRKTEQKLTVESCYDPNQNPNPAPSFNEGTS